ncbi:hypothetical protein DFH83_004307 [Clostridium saccharobutylicum]|nr:hypothetical protein [Clostridium saccharobutylicum]NOW62327.1 hypothetical protein [Clostridium saccharobutylicum]
MQEKIKKNNSKVKLKNEENKTYERNKKIKRVII